MPETALAPSSDPPVPAEPSAHPAEPPVHAAEPLAHAAEPPVHEGFDFLLRLVFFLTTPVLVYAMSRVFSMTAIVGMVVCLLVFLSSAALRDRLSSSGLL